MRLTTLFHTETATLDGRTRYDGFTITLHWLTAVLVVIQFLLAELWDFTPNSSKHLMIVGHMSFGIVLTVVLVLRGVRHVIPGGRIPKATAGPAGVLATIMHYLLYALLAAQMVLGFILLWSDNQSPSFFGLQIPSPFGIFSEATGNLVDEIHDVNAWTMMILASGHALAALFHHFVLNDNVLCRMIANNRTLQLPINKRVPKS